MDCLEKLVECMEGIDIEEMDCDTCLKTQEILSDEIDDPEFLEFAIDNYSELFGYLATGRVNIRIHRDITGFPDLSDYPSERRCRAGRWVKAGVGLLLKPY